ncbi:hypothetical protein ACLMJK_002510 [Lecanora helva]
MSKVSAHKLLSEMDGRSASQGHRQLTGDLAQQNAEIFRLQAERDSLGQAHRACLGEVSELKAKLRGMAEEKANLLREADKMALAADEQKKTIKKLEEQVFKQQKTIKVQSDQIAQRASNARAPTSTTVVSNTPHRGGATSGSFGGIYGQPPPAYNPPSNSLTLPFRPPPPTTPTPQVPSRAPSQSSFGGIYHPIPQNPSATRSLRDSQLARIQEIEPSIELTSDFARIFKLTEAWAHNYVNVPDLDKDDLLPSRLRSSISSFSNIESGMKLMSSGTTRYLTIAKLINYQMTQLAFRPTVARGYTAHYDSKLSEMRSQFYNIVPIEVRRALTTACAQTFKEMTKEADFKKFVERIVARQVHEMWAFFEPLFSPGISRDEAWNDLGQLWRDAVRIGGLMLMKASAFSLDFPAVGPNSLFNPAQMVSRDVSFRQDPQSLAKMGVSVRLAITPVIIETDFMANEPIPKTIHFAQVLLQS